MKKKAVAIGTLLCLIIIITIYFSTPSPVFADDDDFEIHHVSITSQDYGEEDITGRIDCVKLARLLCSYERSRLPHTFSPYQMAVGDIQIDGIAENGPIHILLGRDSVVYESADKGGYAIHDSRRLITEIQKMIKNKR